MSTLAVKQSPMNMRDVAKTNALPSSSAFWRFIEQNLPGEVKLVAFKRDTLYPEHDFDQVILERDVEIVIVPTAEDDQALAALAMLAITLTAIATQQYWAAPLAAKLGVSTATAAALGTAAATMAGGYLVNALLPGPSPVSPSGDQDSLSQSYSWNPQTTQQQGTVIPRGYGTIKCYGNVISAFREFQGEKSYLNVLICLGQGPWSAITDMKINDQPVSQATFPGVTIYTRLGELNQEPIPGFTDTKTEYVDIAANVRNDAGAYVFRTHGSAFDGLEVDLGFNGLGFIDDDNNIAGHSVQVKVEVRNVGDVAWECVSRETLTTSTTVPVSHWSAGAWLPAYDDTGVVSGQYWYEVDSDLIAATHYEGEPYTKAGDTYAQYAWHKVDDSSFAGYTWTTVTTVNEYVTYGGHTRNALVYTLKIPNLTAGQYDVRVTKVSLDQDGLRYLDALSVTAYREVLVGDAFEYPRQVLVGIRGLADDRLSGGVKFSCIADAAIVETYASGVSTRAFSRRHAWAALDVLSQPVLSNAHAVLRYDGVAPSTMLDLDAFEELAADEITPVDDGDGSTEDLFEFNGLFDFKTNVWAAVNRVLEPARTTPIHNGQKLTLTEDKSGTARQLFTVGKIEQDSYAVEWMETANRASEIQTSFQDEDNDYEVTPYSMVNSSVGTDNIVQIDSFGVTKPSRVWRRLTYQLANNQYVLVSCSIRIFVASLVSQIGDIVNVQHDVPQIGQGGLLVSATSSTLTFDRDVTIGAGTHSVLVTFTYPSIVSHGGSDYRCLELNTAAAASEPGVGAQWTTYWEVCTGETPDEAWTSGHDYITSGDIVQRDITDAAGTYRTCNLDSALPRVPAKFDEWALGPTATMVKPFKIADIVPTEDFKAELKLTECNASIWNGDSGTPAVPTPTYTTWDPLPDVTGIVTREIGHASEGLLTCDVIIAWNKPENPVYDHAEVWYASFNQKTNKWTSGLTYAGQTTSDAFTIAGLVPGYYKFIVRTVNAAGLKEGINEAPYVWATIAGFNSVFPKPTGLRLEGTANPHSNVWNGLRFTVVWREASNVRGADHVGADLESAGADSNIQNPYWKYDEVQVWIGSTMYQTLYTKDLRYHYIYGDGYDDFLDAPLITANGAATIKVRRINTRGEASEWASFDIIQQAPLPPSTIDAYVREDGVTFRWDPTPAGAPPLWREPDLDCYRVRTKVDAGAWGSWEDIHDIAYARDLTETEKMAQGKANSTIYIEVKAVDLFGLMSSATTTSASCLNQKPYLTVGTQYNGVFSTVESAIDALVTAGGGTVVLKRSPTPYQLAAEKAIADVAGEIRGESREEVIVDAALDANGFSFASLTKTFIFKDFTLRAKSGTTADPYLITGSGTGKVIVENMITWQPATHGYGVQFGPDTQLVFNGNKCTGGIRAVGFLQSVGGSAIGNIFDGQSGNSIGCGAIRGLTTIKDNVFLNGISTALYVLGDGTDQELILEGNEYYSVTGASGYPYGTMPVFSVEAVAASLSENTAIIQWSDAVSFKGFSLINCTKSKVRHNKVVRTTTVSCGADAYGFYFLDIIGCEILDNIVSVDINEATYNHKGMYFDANSLKSTDHNTVTSNSIDMVRSGLKDYGIDFHPNSCNNQGSDNILYRCGLSIVNGSSYGNNVTGKDTFV